LDKVINEDYDNENLGDPELLCSGSSRPGDGDEIDHGEGEEDTQGSVKGTWKGKGTKYVIRTGKATEDGKGQGVTKGKGKGKGKVKG